MLQVHSNDTFYKFDTLVGKNRLHEQLKSEGYPMVRKSDNFFSHCYFEVNPR